MRTSTSGFVVAIAFVGSACGANVVDLRVTLDDGGSGPSLASADATTDTGAMDSASSFSGSDAFVGNLYGHHDAAVPNCLSTCSATMGTCNHDSDCCMGGRCIGYLCEPPTNCAAPGAPCPAFGSCCSGRCEPSVTAGPPVCASYCTPDNKACTKASDCCSLACNGGMCGGGICGQSGSACQVDSDCCSDDCAPGGHCVVVVSSDTCLASGESCGDGGISCCSGTCNIDTKLCGAAGYGSCLPRNSPCSRDGFSTGCCENEYNGPPALTCMSVGTASIPTCQGCSPDGQRCAADSDCCSKDCNDAGLCGLQECASQQ
jgi:hypothetical protein